MGRGLGPLGARASCPQGYAGRAASPRSQSLPRTPDRVRGRLQYGGDRGDEAAKATSEAAQSRCRIIHKHPLMNPRPPAIAEGGPVAEEQAMKQAQPISGMPGRPCAAPLKKGLTFLNLGFHLDSRASSVERRASSVERRASSVERRASSVERRASSVERRASSVERRASSVERRASSVERRASSVERRASSVERRASSVERRASSVERRASSVERRGHDGASAAGPHFPPIAA